MSNIQAGRLNFFVYMGSQPMRLKGTLQAGEVSGATTVTSSRVRLIYEANSGGFTSFNPSSPTFSPLEVLEPGKAYAVDALQTFDFGPVLPPADPTFRTNLRNWFTVNKPGGGSPAPSGISPATAPTTPLTANRFYWVGNSVSDGGRTGSLRNAVQAAGETLTWGRHMIPGAPLHWNWNNTAAFSEAPFGGWQTALNGYDWDAVMIQPFDSQLTMDFGTGEIGDIVMVQNYINRTMERSFNAANTRFYIYQRYVYRIGGELNYQTRWNTTFVNGNGIPANRSFFNQLLTGVRGAMPSIANRIMLIPVGEVFYELDLQMRAGSIPGWTAIDQVYTDDVHVNDAGAFIIGMTFYSTIYRKSPAALNPSFYNISDTAFANAVKNTVWDVVNGYPGSGVNM